MGQYLPVAVMLIVGLGFAVSSLLKDPAWHLQGYEAGWILAMSGLGTVIGAILLSVISNILNLTSIISVYLNAAVQGIVIIIVAFLQRSRR